MEVNDWLGHRVVFFGGFELDAKAEEQCADSKAEEQCADRIFKKY